MKLSAKTKRDAARLSAACIRATIDGMIGHAPRDMLAAMIQIARDLERQGTGGTRDVATFEMFAREAPAPEVPEVP